MAEGADAIILLLPTAELRAVDIFGPRGASAELGCGRKCDVAVLWTR